MDGLSYGSRLINFLKKVGKIVYYSAPITIPLLMLASSYSLGYGPSDRELKDVIVPMTIVGSSLAASVY